MKKAAKTIALLSLSVLLMFALCGCSYSITTDEAQAHMEDFFAKISDGDMAGAAKLMHPDRGADEKNLRKYIESLEKYDTIDFSKGAVISNYIGYTYIEDNSDVGGSIYFLHFVLTIGDNDFDSQVELVKNFDGFGIYDIYIQPPEVKE